MDSMMLWNILLTFVLTLAGFLVKFLWNEVQRIQILLNKTREEIYRNGLIDRRGSTRCCECKRRDDFNAGT